MLRTKTSDTDIVMIDFGLASMVKAAVQSRVGTIMYMAPEVVAGQFVESKFSHPLSLRCDHNCEKNRFLRRIVRPLVDWSVGVLCALGQLSISVLQRDGNVASSEAQDHRSQLSE